MRRLRPSPAMIVAFIALFIAIGGLVRRDAAAGEERRLEADPQGCGPHDSPRQRRRDRREGQGRFAQRRRTSTSRLAERRHAGERHPRRCRGRAGPGGLRQPAGVGRPGDADGHSSPRRRSPAPRRPARRARSSVGGGVGVDDFTNTAVVDSFPQPGGHAWIARVDNNDTGPRRTASPSPPSASPRPRPAERRDGCRAVVPRPPGTLLRRRGRPCPAGPRAGRSVQRARSGVKFRALRPKDGP